MSDGEIERERQVVVVVVVGEWQVKRYWARIRSSLDVEYIFIAYRVNRDHNAILWKGPGTFLAKVRPTLDEVEG